jgi:hypothetical protein
MNFQTFGIKAMKRIICIGLVFAVFLLVLGLIPYQVKSSNLNQDGRAMNANTSSTASTKWFFDTVDSSPTYDVGQHVSIALDSNETPYISYYEASHKILQMAKYVGSGGNCGPDNSWACETVDHANWVGEYSSIAIDPLDDLPKIAYFDDTDNALKLATNNFSGWNITTIDDPLLGSAGQYASLALNSTVKAGIAYYFSQIPGDDSLRYAQYVGGGVGDCDNTDYRCDIVDSGDRMGKYASLALDSANQPHIAYYDHENDALKYAHYDGSWVKQWIRAGTSGHPAGQFASLAIDVNNGDLPHIAHYDSVNGTLEYAVFVGSDGNCGISGSSIWEWQCDEIDTMGTATHPRGISLALDKEGYPIIAYQSGASVLKIARPAVALDQLIGNCGPATPFYTWQCDAISFGIGIGQGDYVSLALNSEGLSAITYYGNIDNTPKGNLMFAYQRLQVFLPLSLKD